MATAYRRGRAARTLLMASVALFLAGCAIPEFQRPRVDAPAHWRSTPVERESADLSWWSGFGDVVLTEHLAKALTHNHDLAAASERLKEYDARRRLAGAPALPQVTANAAALQQRNLDSYQASLGVAWELDLFGRIAAARSAAGQDYAGLVETRRAVILSLVAAVAEQYVTLLDLDQQLAIARSTLAIRKESLRLFELRFAGGVLSEVEVSQARAEYQSALAAVPQLEQAVAQQEHAFNQLLGLVPGPVRRGSKLAELAALDVPAALPSSLLERRPDLRAAEARLAAAEARVIEARRAHFPKILLTGLLGSASPQLSALFSGPAGTWNYGPSVSLPIYSGGALSASAEALESQREQLLIAYRQSVQAAFREAEDALIAVAKSRQRLDALEDQIAAASRYAEMVRKRYEGGYSAYLDVMDAERLLFSARLAAAQGRGTLHRSVIGLYKVLGGGWIEHAESLVATPEASHLPEGVKE